MTSVIRGSDNFDSGTVGSTTYGAVGTYVSAAEELGEGESASGGDTKAGSTLKTYSNDAGQYGIEANPFAESFANSDATSASLSGTWRLMSPTMSRYTGAYYSSPMNKAALWIRIS